MINTICQTLKTQAAELDFTERLAGLVRPVRRRIDANAPDKRYKQTREFIYPVAMDVTGTECWESGKYAELLPNDMYKSVLYFEQRGDMTLNAAGSSRADKTKEFQLDVRAVCWVNLVKLGATNVEFTDRMALTLMDKILENQGVYTITDDNYNSLFLEVSLIRQPLRSPAIFAGYVTESVSVNYMYPYDYFAIDFRVKAHIGPECYTAAVAGTEIDCAPL